MADDIDHINELQKHLYARDPESMPKQKFGILRPEKQNVPSMWGATAITKDTSIKKTTVTGYKRFFLFSIIFFALALGGALFSIYRGAMTLSSKNVDVTILGNSFVAGGEDLPIQIEVSNRNSGDLLEAELTVEYPKGAIDASGGDVVRLKKELGTIPSGKTKSEAFTVVLYGEQGTTKNVTATLTYRIVNSNAVFQKEQSFAVMISSSPLTLTIDAPATVGNNQPFTLTIRNSFGGDKTLSNAIVRVEYPNGFTFLSATPAPISGGNVWQLGDMDQGTERVVTIKGKLSGEVQDEKSFRVYVGAPEADSSKLAVVYNSVLRTMVITEPFLSGTISINNETSDIIALPLGSDVQGSINWINNSPDVITNPIFTLMLSGDAVSKVSTDDAYYDPLARTITWNPASKQDLATLQPGQRGQLPFSFTTTAPGNDIGLSLSVSGTFPDRDYAQASVTGIDEKTIRFASKLQFAAQALYSVGPFKNTGPFPPKVGQETTYTLTWIMRPTDNPLTGAVATATLMPGVSWAGVIAPQSEAVNFNPETRLVTWNIGSLPKAGSVAQVKSVSFQVKVKPTAAQIGNEIDLLSETTIRAMDTVAKVVVTATRQPLSNRLDTDPAYTPGKERVIP
jgi:hypothetical protein